MAAGTTGRQVSPLFANPFHTPSVIIARLSVTIATMIWSLIVLVNADALSVTRYGSLLVAVVPENVTAAILLAISGTLFYRIIAHSTPHVLAVAGYGALVVGWAFVYFMLFFSPGPVLPTLTAWLTIGLGLSIYSFVATAKDAHVAGA